MVRASRESIDRFVSGKTLALVGVSTTRTNFGTAAHKELKARGYRVFPIHPTAREIQGDRCWASLSELPERVERLLVSVKPSETGAIIRDAAAAGVKQVWFQQGSESQAIVETCRELGMEAVQGKCILMFAEPVGSIHRFHRGLVRVFGRLPR